MDPSRSWREFRRNEESSTGTYHRYNELQQRKLPEEVAKTVSAILDGSIGNRAGAVALLYRASQNCFSREHSSNPVKNLDERYRLYAKRTVRSMYQNGAFWWTMPSGARAPTGSAPWWKPPDGTRRSRKRPTDSTPTSGR